MERFLNIGKYFEYFIFTIVNIILSSSVISLLLIMGLGELTTLLTSGSGFLYEQDGDLIMWCVLYWLVFMILKTFAITLIYCWKSLFPNIHNWLNKSLENKKDLLEKVVVFDIIVNAIVGLIACLVSQDFTMFKGSFLALFITGGGVFFSYLIFILSYKLFKHALN